METFWCYKHKTTDLFSRQRFHQQSWFHFVRTLQTSYFICLQINCWCPNILVFIPRNPFLPRRQRTSMPIHWSVIFYCCCIKLLDAFKVLFLLSSLIINKINYTSVPNQRGSHGSCSTFGLLPCLLFIARNSNPLHLCTLKFKQQRLMLRKYFIIEPSIEENKTDSVMDINGNEFIFRNPLSNPMGKSINK